MNTMDHSLDAASYMTHRLQDPRSYSIGGNGVRYGILGMPHYTTDPPYGSLQYSVVEGHKVKKGDAVVLVEGGVKRLDNETNLPVSGMSPLKKIKSPIEHIQHIVHCLDGTPSPYLDPEGRSKVSGLVVAVSTCGKFCMVSKEMRYR